MAIDNAPVLR